MPLDMDEIVSVRKLSAGADSFGHTWPYDGAVVSMPAREAFALVAIAGAGFMIVPAEPVIEPAPEAEVTEPAPAAAYPVSEQPPPRRRRAAS